MCVFYRMSADLIRPNIIQDNEMIFYKEAGKIMSGGFIVNSSLLNIGSPVASIQNGSDLNGGKKKVSDLFDNLAVPVGLYYTPVEGLSGGKKSRYNYDIEDDENREEISDDIYEQLLKHHIEKNVAKPRKTRKYYKNPKPNKNTRRFYKKNKSNLYI